MLKVLEVRNFRNISHARLNFSHGLNLLIGKNGQGKTNLIEAINLLLTGESFRFGDAAAFIKNGSTSASLSAKIYDNNLDFEVQLRLIEKTKTFLVNQKKVSQLHLQNKFPTIIFSPESLSCIKEGASQRRQLIDSFIPSLNIGSRELLSRFKRALRTRNSILKSIKDGKIPLNQQNHLMASIDEPYLKLCVDLSFLRITALHKLMPDINAAMRFINTKENVEISVEYVISTQNTMEFSYEALGQIHQSRLNDLRKIEIAHGTSLIGPHKHDIRLLYNLKDSRIYCSQGQQRALILAFKMAQIVYHRRVHGVYPLLLLDDVLSELDLDKRSALVAFLATINSQIFITATDLTVPVGLSQKDYSVFQVTEGDFDDNRVNEQLRSGLDTSP